jgi:hypothetical protein
LDIKPKHRPSSVQDLAIDLVQLFVNTAKDATPDDCDSDGETDKAEDARKDNLLP